MTRPVLTAPRLPAERRAGVFRPPGSNRHGADGRDGVPTYGPEHAGRRESNMAEVVLQSLTKRYGRNTAVADLDLAVPDGELLVLVGPSGCGKTTTLRLIAGLESPTAGRILIGGRVVNGLAPRHRQVALVFQHGALYPHLSVYGNLAFGLRCGRVPRSEIDRRVRAAAGKLGLEPLLARRPAELSGGQRQRVALGRALVREPGVWLLDEPLSHLDALLRLSLRQELARLQTESARTMIHVTHDQAEALALGHRVAVLQAGRLQQVGTPGDVYARPANRFVAEFIGSPPMNFTSGKLTAHDGAVAVAGNEFSLTLPADRWDRCAGRLGSLITLGIRPPAITVLAADGPNAAGLTGRIASLQGFDADAYAEVRCGPLNVTARVPPGGPFRPGDPVRLLLDATQCHLFDPTTGAAIG